MKTNVTFSQIVENLTKIFASESESAVYNSNREQYMGICGWCGVMSPLTRPAYIKHFGPATVEKAEQEARARLAENERQYNESAHAAHVIEADKHQQQGNPATVMAGAFVWGIHSGLKCDGGDGLHEEIHNMTAYADMENRRPDLCKVCKVYEVSPADFARPELADELTANARKQGEEFPGGAGIDEEDENRRDLFDPYRYYYVECAAVVCCESGRWYLINSEGYAYARYILLPTSWREMYGAEVSEAERQEQERKNEEARKEAEEKAERLAAYETRCNKWAKLLQDVRPLEEAAEQAKKLHGWGSKEYKQADRALSAARRKNIQTMAAHHFPGLKVSVKKSDHWNAAYDVTFSDGPTLETFGKFTDFDLFVQCVETFNGWDDSTDYHHKEFTEFAEKFAGFAYGGVHVEREQSDESRAELLALVQEVAGISDDERHDWSRATLEAIATRAGVDGDKLEHTIMYEGRVTAAFVARCIFNLKDYTQPDTNPDKPKGRKQATAPAATEGDATQTTKRPNTQTTNEAPAEGLQLIDTADGVAVIGNDWKDTYYNKRQIKAHGATWNKERKQWEATAAEDVASLRAWFALRKAHTESTESAESTPAATLQDSGEITAAALPEWLKVGARVRTHGRHMMTTHSSRPEWVEGEIMTVRAIGPDFVELESRDESGTLRGLESMATATAADQLTPIYSASEISQPAESEPAAIAASEEEGAPMTEPNRDGLPDWLHVGTRFCLLDFVTGKPTAVRYTCAAIDYENKTVTIPEAADTFRGGSHVYRWDAWHWPTFAPITEGEGEAATANYSEAAKSEPTDADKSASWLTNYTADDFQKLTTAGEVNEEDRDIIGRRFRSVNKYGNFFELQIFVQDYAGNEAHALYYILDEFMQEVRACVRSLGWLREKLTEARGWQAA